MLLFTFLYPGDPDLDVGAREWLAENLPNGANVGFDPTLMSVSKYSKQFPIP